MFRYPFGAASMRDDAVERPEGGGELLRDDARRFAQAARELECHGRCQIAELALRRIFDRQLWQCVRRHLIKALKRRQ